MLTTETDRAWDAALANLQKALESGEVTVPRKARQHKPQVTRAMIYQALAKAAREGSIPPDLRTRIAYLADRGQRLPSVVLKALHLTGRPLMKAVGKATHHAEREGLAPVRIVEDEDSIERLMGTRRRPAATGKVIGAPGKGTGFEEQEPDGNGSVAPFDDKQEAIRAKAGRLSNDLAAEVQHERVKSWRFYSVRDGFEKTVTAADILRMSPRAIEEGRIDVQTATMVTTRAERGAFIPDEMLRLMFEG